MKIENKDINKQMEVLRGQLYTFIEASFPAGQQEGAKKMMKQYTQVLWGKLVEGLCGCSGDAEHINDLFVKLELSLFLLVDASLVSSDQSSAAKESIGKILCSIQEKLIKLYNHDESESIV